MLLDLLARRQQALGRMRSKGLHTNHEKLLDGKVAVITGGASGIGATTARLFSKNGAKVVIADIQDGLGSGLAQELGCDAEFMHCDVAREEDVRASVELAASKFKRLDIMLNSAGVASAGTVSSVLASISELLIPEFDFVCNINIKGTLHAVKHAARVMIPQKSGCILTMGSIAGVVAQGGGHPYCISKHAVIGITRSAASELARHGIRVNCISPSAMATPICIDGLKLAQAGLTQEELDNALASNSHLTGIKLTPEDIANAALFLGSDKGRFISGHNLVVDGSYSITNPSRILISSLSSSC